MVGIVIFLSVVCILVIIHCIKRIIRNLDFYYGNILYKKYVVERSKEDNPPLTEKEIKRFLWLDRLDYIGFMTVSMAVSLAARKDEGLYYSLEAGRYVPPEKRKP